MALTPTITYVDATGPVIRVGFNLAASGTYPTGGDTVNLSTAAVDPAYVGMVPSIEALGAPIDMDIWDAGGGFTTGVAASIGTTNANNKMLAFSAFGTQIGNGTAYSGLSIGKLIGEAVYAKL